MASDALDIVYLFSHSHLGAAEIRHSLRSVTAHLPWVRKVWIFGDRPEWLSEDRSIVEHVPQGYLAPLMGWQEPVTSDFLMLFLASLIPELSYEFVRFSDDYIILQPTSREELCVPRALEDLNEIPIRGSSRFQDMLWRTYDILKHYGYPGYNFECHVPMPLNKKLVLEAFLAFRDFLSEDRYSGMLSATTIYNYAIKRHGLKFRWLAEENSKAGFYFSCPSTVAEVAAACEGKRFLNFDDAAYGPALQAFLADRFPDKCKYER